MLGRVLLAPKYVGHVWGLAKKSLELFIITIRDDFQGWMWWQYTQTQNQNNAWVQCRTLDVFHLLIAFSFSSCSKDFGLFLTSCALSWLGDRKLTILQTASDVNRNARRPEVLCWLCGCPPPCRISKSEKEICPPTHLVHQLGKSIGQHHCALFALIIVICIR